MVSDRIKKIIKEKKTTSKEVAEKLNMTSVNFSKVINGNPTLSSLKAIADAIGCEVDDFFEPSKKIQLIINDQLHIFYSSEELKTFLDIQEEK